MRIKKLLITGAFALTAAGCVSAYAYASTKPDNATESSVDESKNNTNDDSNSTTEAKEKTDKDSTKDVKSTKDDSKDDEPKDSKESVDDSENEDVDDKDSTEDVDESEDVTEDYETIQDGDENDAVCKHKWGAEQGGYDSEKGYFYWRECEECGQQKIDRYVSEEEYLKNDSDYNEPSKDADATEVDNSADNTAEISTTETTGNNN